MNHTITLSDRFEKALAQAAKDNSVSADQFLLDQAQYALTETANRLDQQAMQQTVAAFNAAADTDTKAAIVSAVASAAVDPIKP